MKPYLGMPCLLLIFLLLLGALSRRGWAGEIDETVSNFDSASATAPFQPQIYDYEVLNSQMPLRTPYFSFNQASQLYLSTYRQGMRAAYEGIREPWIYFTVNGLVTLLMPPFVHEEGHRGILTRREISSVDTLGVLAGHVKGVTDSTLQNIRDSDLPTFIHLHTGGTEIWLEQNLEISSHQIFRQEPRAIATAQYFYNKIGLFAYQTFVPGIHEQEANELDRDIVGHDFFGAIRHLHRPQEAFWRYTSENDLTGEENDFLNHRVRRKAYLNWMDGFLFRPYFESENSVRWNLSLDYNLAPFGDQERLHFYSALGRIQGRLSFQLSHNRTQTFPGLVVVLDRMPVFSDRFFVSMGSGIWLQPRALAFDASEGEAGGYLNFNPEFEFTRGARAGLGLLWKSAGYLPSSPYLGTQFEVSAHLALVY